VKWDLFIYLFFCKKKGWKNYELFVWIEIRNDWIDIKFKWDLIFFFDRKLKIYIFANNFEKMLFFFLRNEKESQNGAKTICQTLPSFSRHFYFSCPFYMFNILSIFQKHWILYSSSEFFRQNFMVHVRL